ncbi:sensor histidine kinase [Azotosporobacter soli]|uniref:sensor histidine kinase n=1 Tax=Azotosporobacter soli TaxID=3055040 RepID=UPI0031FE8206
MFSRIRNQLTLLYTLLTACSLLGFALLFYFGLSSLLLREEEQATIELAKRQLLVYHELLEKAEHSRSEAKGKRSPLVTVSGDNFYYLLTKDGQLLGGNEPVPSLRADILARAASQLPGRAESVKFSLEDGRELSLMLASVPVNSEERVSGQLIMAKDLSAYAHFQRLLLQSLSAASLVFLLVAALAGHVAAGRALIPIRKSFAAQRQFVADASHELRTPLSVIQASLDVLEQEEGSRISGLSQQILADAKDEVRRMSRLVGDLLTLARADSGALEILRTEFALRPVAEHVIRSLQHIARPKDIALVLDAPSEMLIHADRDRLSQLFFLLLDNGIKYTPPGGCVTLSIAAAADKKTPGISIVVRDTGSGIAAADLPLIFERFYRADKTRSRVDGGFGLGLPIARWIVEAHGGEIEVASRPDGGTAFNIFLPL